MKESGKMKKKALFILMVMIISAISLTALQATAVSQVSIDEIDYTYEYEGMTSEKAEQIVKVMFEIYDSPIQPASLLCLFGHNIEHGAIRTIAHRVRPSPPRCDETIAYLEFCTRNNCSHFVVTGESTIPKFCCP